MPAVATVSALLRSRMRATVFASYLSKPYSLIQTTAQIVAVGLHAQPALQGGLLAGVRHKAAAANHVEPERPLAAVVEALPHPITLGLAGFLLLEPQPKSN
jgi:hypothetical protein